MQKRSTRWMNLLMRAFNSALLVLFSAAVGAAEEEPAPIEYEITSPKGSTTGRLMVRPLIRIGVEAPSTVR